MAGSIERRGGGGAAQPGPTPDFGLAWHVGSATLNRARGIVAGGSILDLQVVQPGELAASVLGSRAWPYETDVRFSLVRGQVKYFESSCDCPMESDCKHGVAVLLHHLLSTVDGVATTGPHPPSTVLELNRAQPAPWERSLNRLLGTPPSVGLHPARERTPLGLQFAISVNEPENLLSPAQVGIRPMQRGAKGRWVTTGVSWRDSAVRRSTRASTRTNSWRPCARSPRPRAAGPRGTRRRPGSRRTVRSVPASGICWNGRRKRASSSVAAVRAPVTSRSRVRPPG